jgi:tRNA (guanine26-N2/guanine27-N2)-dimethyltransferase
MLNLTPKTLSPSPFLFNPIPQNPRLTIQLKPTTIANYKFDYQTEKGLELARHSFGTRAPRAKISACSLPISTSKSKSKLRVLDTLHGCGIRSLRYLVEADADFVRANDGNDEYQRIILENLRRSRVPRGFRDDEWRWEVTLTHFDANRLMTECYQQKGFV